MSTATTTTPAPLTSGGGPTLFVADMSRAAHFYTQVLGLRIAYQAADHFAMIDGGKGLMIGLHPPGEHTPRPGGGGSIELCLNVAAPIADVVRSLQSRGVKFEDRGKGPIIDDTQVKLAFFSDPDGNSLYLCEVKR
jgi:catechol 2,3-dioxygenase-like lactoylglutathione lyase family enzyme